MSYLLNKKNRLKTKYRNILAKDFGIVMSDSPTEIIVICNCGLSNGITHEMIWDVFHKFDNLEQIIMIPGKSYSFARFNSKIHAKNAFENINGKVIWSSVNGPVNLNFVENFNVTLLQQAINFDKPPGLIVIENFITDEEEKSILQIFGLNGNIEKDSSKLKNRKVRHYGYEFKYSTNNIDLNEPIEKIPSEINYLWIRLKQYLNEENNYYINFIPDQLTINCYEPGQGIPSHVDTHSAFEDGILSLSLESSVVMEFKSEQKTCNVVLPRRSLCIMLGESRYNWTHGITPRKSDLVPNKYGGLTVQNRKRRISFTFRKTRSRTCMCSYPRLCDSATEKLKSSQQIPEFKNLSLKEEAASELEKNFVHGVYDKIASHFSETRYKPWPKVFDFVNSFGPGSIFVDIGCGNGKYFTNQSKRFEIGCDSNSSLMQVCREKNLECFSCNCLNIPLRDSIADGCICIAVIHHLTTEERRQRAIEEIIRVLKTKGKALIYVWAKNQELKGKKSFYLKQNQQNNFSSEGKTYNVEVVSLNKCQQEIVLPVHNNRTAFSHNDMLVPWKLKVKKLESPPPVYLRFYHVYEDDELKNICMKLKNVNILDYYYDQGNWCIIIEKI